MIQGSLVLMCIHLEHEQPRSETGSYIPITVKSYTYIPQLLSFHMQRCHFSLIQDYVSSFEVWVVGFWPPATGEEVGEQGPRALLHTHTEWEGGALGPPGPGKRVWGWSRTEGPAALSLGRPGGPSCRTGCWSSSATVGLFLFTAGTCSEGSLLPV